MKGGCLCEVVIQNRTSEELHTRGHKLCRGNKVCSGGRSGDVVDMSVGGGTIWGMVETWIWDGPRSPRCKVVVGSGKHRRVWLIGWVRRWLALFLHQWEKCSA